MNGGPRPRRRPRMRQTWSQWKQRDTETPTTSSNRLLQVPRARKTTTRRPTTTMGRRALRPWRSRPRCPRCRRPHHGARHSRSARPAPRRPRHPRPPRPPHLCRHHPRQHHRPRHHRQQRHHHPRHQLHQRPRHAPPPHRRRRPTGRSTVRPRPKARCTVLRPPTDLRPVRSRSTGRRRRPPPRHPRHRAIARRPPAPDTCVPRRRRTPRPMIAGLASRTFLVDHDPHPVGSTSVG